MTTKKRLADLLREEAQQPQDPEVEAIQRQLRSL
jgi:hypothetical protein